MKTGKTIEELYAELERQRNYRKDYIADTRTVKVTTQDNASILTLGTGTDVVELTISDLAHRQLAERLQIPFKYYERMQGSFPALLDKNINGWLSATPDRRMIRTLDGNVRAFLSDRYRRLDNLELADAVLPVIAEMTGADIVSAEITETRMYIKVVNTTITAELQAGDFFQAGFVLSNSEVGLGAVKVEPLIYRLVCSNGLIAKDFATKKYHTGRQINNLDDVYEMFSDQTMMADDMAFFMKVQDIVKVAVDERKFNLCLSRLKLSMHESTGDDPIRTVEELGDKYTLNRHERANILGHFMAAKDLSRYSLINAVTRASQDISDYNRATDFERLGGEILAEVVG